MDIVKMLVTLRSERDRLGEAILAIERLAAGQGKRRGRPPKWMQDIRKDSSEGGKKTRKAKRSRFSAATRRKMSAAQKVRWANRRRVIANG